MADIIMLRSVVKNVKKNIMPQWHSLDKRHPAGVEMPRKTQACPEALPVPKLAEASGTCLSLAAGMRVGGTGAFFCRGGGNLCGH